MFRAIILPIFRSHRPATSWVHYTTSCNTQFSAPEDGQNNCPKLVELTGIINKLLLLHLVGCLYYLYQWRMVKQIPDNEIYLLIKYMKCILWRVVKHLSYIEDAQCLKVKQTTGTKPVPCLYCFLPFVWSSKLVSLFQYHAVKTFRYHALWTHSGTMHCEHLPVPCTVNTFRYHALWTPSGTMHCEHILVPCTVNTFWYHALWTPSGTMHCEHLY